MSTNIAKDRPMTTAITTKQALFTKRKQKNVLPGFSLSLGYTILYLSLIVLIPLSAAFIKTTELSFAEFWETVTSPRVVASYQLTFGASLIGAGINAVFGLLTAWVLVRYSFPGKKIVDALVDLPFALPTAVSAMPATAVGKANGRSTSASTIFLPGKL